MDDVGMVCVGQVNSVGAAAAVAKLLGLDAAGILNAMANSIAQAGWCPAEVIFGDGGTIKPMLFGAVPAAAAIAGAFHAQQGITGPSQILESPLGYLRAAAKSFDLSPLYDDEKWYLAEPRRKFHACCGYIHSAADSMIAIRRDGIDLTLVKEIEVFVPPYIIPAVSKSYLPSAPNQARFHLQYCLALALLSEDVILPLHSDKYLSYMSDRDVQMVMSMTTVKASADYRHYHQSKVVLRDNRGAIIIARENFSPKGTPKNPLSDEEVVQKFIRLTNRFAERVDLRSYVERAINMHSAEDVRWIVSTFSVD
jgi:2-methylcitrate dehydratase PrpD